MGQLRAASATCQEKAFLDWDGRCRSSHHYRSVALEQDKFINIDRSCHCGRIISSLCTPESNLRGAHPSHYADQQPIKSDRARLLRQLYSNDQRVLQVKGDHSDYRRDLFRYLLRWVSERDKRVWQQHWWFRNRDPYRWTIQGSWVHVFWLLIISDNFETDILSRWLARRLCHFPPFRKRRNYPQDNPRICFRMLVRSLRTGPIGIHQGFLYGWSDVHIPQVCDCLASILYLEALFCAQGTRIRRWPAWGCLLRLPVFLSIFSAAR